MSTHTQRKKREKIIAQLLEDEQSGKGKKRHEKMSGATTVGEI